MVLSLISPTPYQSPDQGGQGINWHDWNDKLVEQSGKPVEEHLVRPVDRAEVSRGVVRFVNDRGIEDDGRNADQIRLVVVYKVGEVATDYTEAQKEFLAKFCGEGTLFEAAEDGIVKIDLSDQEAITELFGGIHKAELLQEEFMRVAPQFIKMAPVGAVAVEKKGEELSFYDLATDEPITPDPEWVEEVQDHGSLLQDGQKKVIVFDTKELGERTQPYVFGAGEDFDHDQEQFIEQHRTNSSMPNTWDSVAPPRIILELPEGNAIENTARSHEGPRRHLVYNPSSDTWYMMAENVFAEDFGYIRAASEHYYVTELMRDVEGLTEIGGQMHRDYCRRYQYADAKNIEGEKAAALGLTNISAADTCATLRGDSVTHISQDSALYIQNLQDIVTGDLTPEEVLWFAQISHGGWAAAKRFQSTIKPEQAGFLSLSWDQVESSLYAVQLGAMEILKRLKQDSGLEIKQFPKEDVLIGKAQHMVDIKDEAISQFSRDLMADQNLVKDILSELGVTDEKAGPIHYAAVTGVQLGIVRLAQYCNRQRQQESGASAVITDEDYLQALYYISHFEELEDPLKLHIGKLMHFTWQATQAPRDINRVARGINASFSSGVMTDTDVLQLDYDQVVNKTAVICKVVGRHDKLKSVLSKAGLQ